MANYTLVDDELERLKGKVILITGGATGIGRATVDLAHRHGAKVAFCDVNEDVGKAVEQELGSNILFQKCDVSKWADVVSFFQSTYDKFGPIDAAISNAAINIVEPFDDLKDATKAKTSELKEPDLSVLNVNMVGTWYVTKCAVHFFDKHPETPSQLVLFGSVASFFDTPPLYTYCASKAAVVGLMRALRTQLPKRNATVNVIAPWMTITAMVTDRIKEVWGDLPANEPIDVAKASLLPVMRPDINGKSFLINGGNITELEDKLAETQHIWLGPKLSEDMIDGQGRLIP